MGCRGRGHLSLQTKSPLTCRHPTAPRLKSPHILPQPFDSGFCNRAAFFQPPPPPPGAAGGGSRMDFYRCCRNGALLAAGDKVPERQKEKWKPSAAGGGVGWGEVKVSSCRWLPCVPSLRGAGKHCDCLSSPGSRQPGSVPGSSVGWEPEELPLEHGADIGSPPFTGLQSRGVISARVRC